MRKEYCSQSEMPLDSHQIQSADNEDILQSVNSPTIKNDFTSHEYSIECNKCSLCRLTPIGPTYPESTFFFNECGHTYCVNCIKGLTRMKCPQCNSTPTQSKIQTNSQQLEINILNCPECLYKVEDQRAYEINCPACHHLWCKQCG